MANDSGSLLPLSCFDSIFELICRQTVVYQDVHGNVGDQLIYAATRQLFQRYNITAVTAGDPRATAAQCVLCCGGGNVGTLYPDCVGLRQLAYRLAEERGLGMIILPQSFSGPEDLPPKTRVFVRERYSLRFCPDATVAPDLSLGFVNQWPLPESSHDLGIRLRTDWEDIGHSLCSLGDSVHEILNPRDYLALAARYENIITDRLHFAIAALIAGRRASLLSNIYRKNRGVYEAWLKDLGCQWITLTAAASQRDKAQR